MVVYYSIFGKQVASHYLSMATLGTLFGGSYLATRGGSKQPANNTPPINASSSDEADFVKKFLDSAEADAKKAAKH